jgi:hypothetical protein
MAEILELESPQAPAAARAVEALEAGGLVLLPQLEFEVSADERPLMDPAVLEPGTKNVSFDPTTGKLGGSRLEGEAQAALTGMVRRYSQFAAGLLGALAPAYAPALQMRRTSYRPGAVETRALSPRKDDRRLHIDAFPANPVQGRRILRVFTNVNPQGERRIWNVGEDGFAALAERFRGRLRPPPPGAGWALERLKLTKGRRTPYDDAMLKLHDAAKLDEGYQQAAPKRRLEFPSGSTWIVCTDATLHAALQGQHCLEQTFLLPVESMREQARAPLRVLERVTGRRLV